MTSLGKFKALVPKWKDPANIAIFCLLGMVAGFLFSRVLLTLSMALMGANALRGGGTLTLCQRRYLYWGIAWVGLYGLSGLWSSDINRWWEHFMEKWPLALLPVAFALTPRWKPSDMKLLLWGMGLALLVGTGYSFFLFLEAPAAILQSYGYAKVMPTPAEGDHIRFSLLIALYLFLVLQSWPLFERIPERVTLGVLLSLLVLYLHFLAARTGLLVLYLGLLTLGLRTLIQGSWWRGMALMLILALGLVLAVRMIPTLSAKWGYVAYTIAQWEEGNRSMDYSDLGRWVSWDLGIQMLITSPWIGVGAGDQYAAMRSAFASAYPDLPADRVLLPHNQFLTMALAMGIPATCVFICWFFYPFRYFRSGRSGFYLALIGLSLFWPLWIEPILEIQFGVFVYAVVGGIALKIFYSLKEEET